MAAIDYSRDVLAGSQILMWLAVFLVGTLVERLAPAEGRQPPSERRLNVAYAVFSGWLAFAAAPLSGVVATSVVNALGGGLIVLPSAGWPLVLSVALYVFAIDFMEYLFHRVQHAWPVLWAMHSFHHSDRSVNVTTTTRHFWLELPIKTVFIYPLAAIILRVPPGVLAFYAASTLYNFVCHLNLRCSVGPLWAVINSPQYHRIHHSTLLQHRNRNFAAMFPIFDIVFGTHYRPARGEFPSTGLDTGEAPANFLEAALWPLRGVLAARRSKRQP